MSLKFFLVILIYIAVMDLEFPANAGVTLSFSTLRRYVSQLSISASYLHVANVPSLEVALLKYQHLDLLFAHA